MAEELNTEELQGLIKTSDTPIVVDFWAPWCGPCRAQSPIVEYWAEKHGENVSVAKLNLDQYGDFATQLGIQSIPTIILFSMGEEKARAVGLQDESSLDDMLGKA